MQPHLVSQINVSSSPIDPAYYMQATMADMCRLMTEMVAAQERQNELLEELVDQVSCSHRQKVAELANWKKSNPQLARFCRLASEKLGRIQTDYITSLTEEIEEHAEDLQEGEYMLNEFLDRFGPRFMHLNSLLQVLVQLGNVPDNLKPPRRRNSHQKSATF